MKRIRYNYNLILRICMITSLSFSYIPFCFAQDENLVPKYQTPTIIPSSPQSQLFEKYVDQPVSEYNGLVEISIPLYNIEMKGLTIPISLNYHASGIKYGEFDGEVGAGWTLSVGGYRISRTVHGKPDGYYSTEYRPTEYDKYVKKKEGERFTDDAYLASVAHNNPDPYYSTNFSHLYNAHSLIDGEYDVYTYMLPNCSGHFILESEDVVILEDNPEAIERVGNYAFHISDSKGFVYDLGGGEKHLETSGKHGYNTGWVLNSIHSPYNETISFEYKEYQGYDNERTKLSTLAISSDNLSTGMNGYGDYGASSNSKVMLSPESVIPNILLIKQIKTESEIIEFNRDESPYSKLISKIVIKDKQNRIIKEIDLSYKGYGDNKTSGVYHDLLNTVSFSGRDIEKEEYKYDMSYYSPSTTSNGFHYYPDYWGYYLYSNSNKGSDPEINNPFYDELWSKDDYIHIHKSNNLGTVNWKDIESETKASYPHLKLWYPRMDVGSQRTISNQNHIFSLETITYPTGGKRRFHYESHCFKPSTNGAWRGYGAGIRIKKIITYPQIGPISTTEYEYGNINGENGYFNCDINHPKYYFSNNYINFHHKQYLLGEEPLSTPTFSSVYQYFGENGLFNSFKVFYAQVTTTISSSDGSLPYKTESFYNIPVQYIEGQTTLANVMSGLLHPYHVNRNNQIKDYYYGQKANLGTKNHYIGGRLIRRESYKYRPTNTINNMGLTSFRGLKVFQSVFFDDSFPDINYSSEYVGYLRYNFTDVSFDHMESYIHTGSSLLESKMTVHYNDDNRSNTEFESYEYNEKNILAKTIKQNSEGGTLTTEYKYPLDFKDAIYQKMVKNNNITEVIETVTHHNGEEIHRTKTDFSEKDHNLILPDKVITTTNHKSRNSIIFNHYDAQKGNVLQYTTSDNISTLYLWSYNNKYPIAKIINASYSEVETAVKNVFAVSSIEALTKLEKPDEEKLLNSSLQKALSNAIVTTYTYEPFSGITSETSPAGIITFYEYDGHRRLKRVYLIDSFGNEKNIESYEYNYSNKKK